MRILISILLLSFTINTAFTQQRAGIDSFSQMLSPVIEDSLKKTLSASRKDSSRVLIMHSLSYAVLFSKPDSAMYLAQEGLKLARLIGFRKGEALCRSDIGAVWWILGDYTKADEVLLEAVKLADSINDRQSQEWSLSFLVSSNRDQGNFEEALKLCMRGAARGQFFSKEIWNVITGSVYQEMSKLDSALFYLHHGDSGEYNLLMLGNSYAKMGNNSLALSYYKKAIPRLAGSNNFKDLTDAYIGMAKVYEKENKIDSSIHYAKRGFRLAENASFKKWVYETALILSRVYEKVDAAEALKYFKLAMRAKDSMFNIQQVTERLSSKYIEQLRQKEVQAAEINYRNSIRTYILLATVCFFLILALILYRNNKHKQKARDKIETAYTELKAAQAQLIQSEKMASLGELTAGIAHEIQNPLNFVNNFSEVSAEMLDELEKELLTGNGNQDEGVALVSDIKLNLDKIIHHGKRADAIVKGMLQHTQNGTGRKEFTDINNLAEEYFDLAYNGHRAKDSTFSVIMKTDFDKSIGEIEIIPQDIGRVVLNMINNAIYAVTEKKKEQPEGFEPIVSLSTKKMDDKVLISVKDNGNGIPQKWLDKIFQPFFTTKPAGQGTGLGLSLSYDFVKAHGGELRVETKEGEGSEFIVLLPR